MKPELSLFLPYPYRYAENLCSTFGRLPSLALRHRVGAARLHIWL
jgi:hypothetical protein